MTEIKLKTGETITYVVENPPKKHEPRKRDNRGIGVTRKDKEQSKTNRKISVHSRKINRRKK